MYEDDDGVDDGADEPLEQSILQKSILLRDIFWACGGGSSAIAQKYKEAIVLAQMKGQAPAGVFAETAGVLQQQLIERWIEKATHAGAGNLAEWQDVRIGRADESFHADRLVDAIALDVKVERPGAPPFIQRVNLYGTMRRISPTLDAAMQGVIRDTTKPRDLLALVIPTIALSAAGEPIDPNFHAIVVGGGESPASVTKFPPMSRETARQYLTKLTSELLSGATNYFLPIEAVESVHTALKKSENDLLEKVEAVRAEIDNKKHRCHSEYGPIRRAVAHSFEPPELDQLLTIIKDRYSPIAGIFDCWKTI
jgi:hypothetical protein